MVERTEAFAPASATETREYVVITTPALSAAFQTLTNYRETTEGGGLTTHIETIDYIESNYSGRDSAEKVRNFIIDQYNNYGTQFVLLGGDADGPQGSHVIPTRNNSIDFSFNDESDDDNIIGDYYFSCLDGDWNSDGDNLWGEPTDGINGGYVDSDPEVAIGRITADTSVEALNQINKIITFESMDNPPYKTLLMGEHMGSEVYGGDYMNFVYTGTNYMPRQKLYDLENSWNSSDLISHINSNNFNILNHLGHSNTHSNMKMSRDEIDLLTNTTPVVIFSQGCYPAAFDNRNARSNMAEETYASPDYDSFAEKITVETQYGAFAYIGNSRYGCMVLLAIIHLILFIMNT